MSQYLLSSSDTWVCQENVASLNSTTIDAYLILQLKEQQEIIKIEEHFSDTGDEDETKQF